MQTVLKKYSDVFNQDGTWCTVLADAGTGTVDSLEALDVRPGQVRDRMLDAGAPEEDARAVEQALQPLEGIPNPVARFVLAHNGQVVADEVLPGQRVDSPYVQVGEVPDLIPLIRYEADDLPVVTVSVDRTGADISLKFSRRGGIVGESDIELTMQGSTENIHKVPGGGWAQRKYRQRTEDTWRKNADEVAEEIDRLVVAERPAVVAIGGDQRARQLVMDQLSESSRAIAAFVETHTRAGGADPGILQSSVEKLLAEKLAHEQRALLDRLAQEKGRAQSGAAFGLADVVHALQQAQVETLLISETLAADNSLGHTATEPAPATSGAAATLVVFDASPWIATEEAEALGANVLGKAPVASALVRAAALTDAKVELLPPGALPKGTQVAALLRWPHEAAQGPGV
jgi:hypothetical protein